MTITPEAKSRIDDRIKRLAGQRSSATARDELRQHVLDAATDSALGKPVTIQHVDQAFDELGNDDDIRVAFFPGRSNAARARPLVRSTVAWLGIAAALAVGAVLIDGGGEASCTVEGEGSCQATTAGQFLDVVLWGLPPLVILALLAGLPTWPGLVAATAYACMTVLRLVTAGSAVSEVEVALAMAGGLTLAATIWQWRRGKGASHA